MVKKSHFEQRLQADTDLIDAVLITMKYKRWLDSDLAGLREGLSDSLKKMLAELS